LHEQSALALSRAIHAREISARELMEATLARIEAVNPSVNAVISLRDTQELLGEAEAADADLAKGRSRGVLHGFPHAVKDLAMTAGIPTTMGSPVFARQVPAERSSSARPTRRSSAWDRIPTTRSSARRATPTTAPARPVAPAAAPPWPWPRECFRSRTDPT
jgi:Asp-tRNA(Asn)/Glu-tRNA(Gln) amidotransferase A subunit family amidase